MGAGDVRVFLDSHHTTITAWSVLLALHITDSTADLARNPCIRIPDFKTTVHGNPFGP